MAWHNESRRHALASKGIKTAIKNKPVVDRKTAFQKKNTPENRKKLLDMGFDDNTVTNILYYDYKIIDEYPDTMKTKRNAERYYFTVEKRKNDYYGNPRNRVTVKKQLPNGEMETVVSGEDIGYRGDKQAVHDIINEYKGWKNKYIVKGSRSGNTYNESELKEKKGTIMIREI